jgi:hypothetical protein
MLGRVFGCKRWEVTGGWGSLHNKELNKLYASSNIIRVIKLRMRWVGHVAHMGEMRNVYVTLVGSLKGRDHAEDLGVDGKIILEFILGKQGGKVFTGFIWPWIGTSGRLF